MYELVNIFAIFLPQLLLYPNPKDPLNSEAARLLMNDEKAYNTKVKDYVLRYASSHLTQQETEIVPVSKKAVEKSREALSETSQVAPSESDEDSLGSEIGDLDESEEE